MEIAERFWAKVQRGEGCWPWLGCRCKAGKGYGRFGVKVGWVENAHRMAWELTFGPIPEGISVLHHCDNPGCVNPSHLFLGTQRDNILDAIKKGRAYIPHFVGETHGSAKLTEQDVLCLRTLAALGDVNKSALAREYGVTQPAIRYAITGRSWRHLGDRFQPCQEVPNADA